MNVSRRKFLSAAMLLVMPVFPAAVAEAPSKSLLVAARKQIGVTTSYDPAYRRLDFPMGDVPRTTGVCTDVVIRAYRDAFGFDFQAAINKDMRADFRAYPTIWGLSRPDRNIDHRRVPNLETFLIRKGYEADGTLLPGDLVSLRLGGNLPHITIVSKMSDQFQSSEIIHNIGSGTREEPVFFDAQNIRHFRFLPSTTSQTT